MAKLSVLTHMCSALLAGITLCPVQVCAASADSKPNIIFIISDDQRWDGLGIAGNTNIKTPNLDRMAREGQWYPEATIQIPTCSASRSAILTGIPPYRNGWYSNSHQREDILNGHGFDQYDLLPKEMVKAGYHTAVTGKWHIKPDPWVVGFETVKHFMLGGMGPYLNPRLAEGKSRDTKIVKGFTQTIFADDALSILKDKADGKTTQPLFLWVAFTAPHAHFHPNPAPFAGMYDGKTPDELAPKTLYYDPNTIRRPNEIWRQYYEAISALDHEVGRIVDTVRNSSLSTNTLVVFISDNGFMMGSRNMWGKYVAYEDSLRVPMIVWGPDSIVGTKGTTVTASVNSLDLSPTFVKLAGGTPPKSWTGRDISPVMKDGKSHDIDWTISCYPDYTSPHEHVKAYRVIRTPDYKLIYFYPKSGEKNAFYDLKKDPAEKNNLYGKPEVATAQKKLEKILDEYRSKTGDNTWEMKGPVVSMRDDDEHKGKKKKARVDGANRRNRTANKKNPGQKPAN